MNRKIFIKTFSLIQLAGFTGLKSFAKIAEGFSASPLMPVLFLGHGSPMNAIEENEFVHGWRETAKNLPRPNAILCVSAHWETKGTFVTAMEKPKTIHDFGGFPKALFDVQYPAPGSSEIAAQTKIAVKKTNVGSDQNWGLDHGCWSVLKPMFPKADIPVLQLSIDYTQPAQYHYDLAKELQPLRSKGILIIGSGNMVHNLGKIAWDKIKEPQYGFDWALTANEKLRKLILSGDHKQIINYKSIGSEMLLSVPSPEHYLPMLYSLALKRENEKINLFNDKTIMGSISMTSFRIG